MWRGREFEDRIVRRVRRKLERRLARRLEPLSADVARLQAELAALRDRFHESSEIELEVRRQALDRIPDLQKALGRLRAGTEYEAAFADAEPLVSVRIASYERTGELMEVALPSVFAQTYPRIEVVVVNDGPNPATRAAIGKLADPRVCYHELPTRGEYPDEPMSRWRVAGTPAGNHGNARARGLWIAPLDDDDEFTPDHIERLLVLARASRAEVAYGALVQRNLVTGRERLVWSDPPQYAGFSFQGALVHAGLQVFAYDELAWTLHEPGDWNLMRRMLAAGVHTAATREIVGFLNTVPPRDK